MQNHSTSGYNTFRNQIVMRKHVVFIGTYYGYIQPNDISSALTEIV